MVTNFNMAKTINSKGLTLAFLVAILCYRAKGCDDVSRKACQQLTSQNTELCNDACFSSVCQRSCGKCALRCFSCSEVDRLNQCNTTTECPSTDHQCISVKSFNSQFKEVYKLGCAIGSICDTESLETSCCTYDLCNNKTPTTTVITTTTTVPSTTTTPRSTPSPTTSTINPTANTETTMETTMVTRGTDGTGVLLVGKRENNDPLCLESSPGICQELVASDPNVCSKDCIKSMCPVSCGKCKTCYDCSYVADSDLCNMTSICKHDELCYGLETVNSYREHGFRLGCAPQQVCDSIASISTNTFGRRSQRDLIGGCCGDNLCNTHIKPITTPTPEPKTTVSSTTPSTTTENFCHCPPNAHTYNQDCFFVSNVTFTRNDAKSFCQSRCANLARFQSSAELRVIEREIYQHFLHHSTGRRFIYDTLYGPHGVFIDAVYDPRRHWIWETTQERISHDVYQNQTNPHHHHCAVTNYYFLRSHIRPVECDSSHYALCLLDRPRVF
ncbi:uncharacterized protein LOC125675276 [Ostrea edulis]|uniref:uncharacterized protein LOC125675276 n=1 Tax=Ostrea edulis TaxID=37623 RepID=UPI0020944D74|nr:uncharacterized protein LOC125675276 [Ostrea edulis]